MSETFKPGDKVERSGIYEVVHDRTHTQNHEVTCVAGHTFPPCRGCGHGVRFRPVRYAQHISSHEQFK